MNNKKLIALAISAGMIAPGMASAAKVAGDALDIYGKAHISLDRVTSNNGTDDKSNFSLSSNSSRLGFKGEVPVGSVKGFYKIEGSISMENSGGVIDHRAAYAGIKDGFGSVLAGYRDTAYKDVRGKFDLFGDTVGDARDIIGSIANPTSAGKNNIFDKRAKNAIMYTSPNAGGFVANVMYSTAWNGDTSNQAGQDNNNESLESLNLQYHIKGLMLALGWEQQKHASTTTGDTTSKGTGTRLVATYKMEPMRIGLIYEKLDDDTTKANKRSAYGLNFSIKAGPGTAKVQYVKAGDDDSASSTGANQVSLGYNFKLDKHSSTYVAYSKLSNDSNATYTMGNGHDQTYLTATGKNVSALSVGYILSF